MRPRCRGAAVPAALLAVLLAGCHPGGAGTGDRGGAAPHHRGAGAAEPVFALRAGDRVLSLDLARPYSPAAPHGGTDDYRCFLLDPGLDRPAFITGMGFVPGTAEVHHAILFRVPADRVPAAEALDARTPGDGWTCFGGTQIPVRGSADRSGNDGWLDAWAPGGKPSTYADGFGVPLEARSRVVLQVHYNLLAGTAPDRTGVRLRLAPARRGMTPLSTALFPAPVELPCTPAERGPLCARDAAVRDVTARFGADTGRVAAGLQRLCGGDPRRPRAGSTQHCDIRIPAPMTVRAGAGHMHLLGRSIRVTVDPGTARERVLIDVPAYDFDNQGSRTLAHPVHLRTGDTVRVTCTHDAALRSLLPALASQPPRYVVWGEGTSDEMCLGILTVTRP
jgi:hypothetical protein